MTLWTVRYTDHDGKAWVYPKRMKHSEALKIARWLMRKRPNAKPRARAITLDPAS